MTLPVAAPVTLPQLTHWQRRDEASEVDPRFDDSGWRKADLRTSGSITKPLSDPVLLADDYGFHVGNTWYRAHFSGGAQAPTGIALRVKSGGPAGAYSAWLNGRFLGSMKGDEDASFGFPPEYLAGGDNVLSVLTVNMGHDEDYDLKSTNRNARGIVMATPLGASPTALTWYIQGRRGGEGATDPVRGPYNEGGLYGEREGWHREAPAGREWTPTTLPARDDRAGVTWYRTQAALDLPRDQDTSLGIAIKDPPGRHYRAILFVNGWQMGLYVADVGPQHVFPIPTGVIDPHGKNDIAIAVWNTDGSGGGLGEVALVSFGSVKSPISAAGAR